MPLSWGLPAVALEGAVCLPSPPEVLAPGAGPAAPAGWLALCAHEYSCCVCAGVCVCVLCCCRAQLRSPQVLPLPSQLDWGRTRPF